MHEEEAPVSFQAFLRLAATSQIALTQLSVSCSIEDSSSYNASRRLTSYFTRQQLQRQFYPEGVRWLATLDPAADCGPYRALATFPSAAV